MNIAVLLNGRVKNDHRVIKTIHTLAKLMNVDLFYLDGNASEDARLFPENVRLFPIAKKNNLLQKIQRHSTFYNELNYLAEEVKKSGKTYDYIWANDLPCLKSALIVKGKSKTKVIYDSHEVYIETINQFFPKNSSFIKSIIFKIFIAKMRFLGKIAERKMVKQIDCFITVNEKILDLFNHIYQLPKNQFVVMNTPKLKDNKDINPIDFRTMFDWNDNDIILIYQGSINPGRSLDKLIQAMADTKETVKLVFIGKGNLKEGLIKLSKENQLTGRIKFLEPVEIAELAQYTAGADFGIVFLEKLNLSTNLASPNKLFEYMHALTPIIGTDSYGINEILSEFKIGLQTDNSVNAISNCLNSLTKDNIAFYKEECEKARKKYRWRKQEQKIINYFEQ